VYFLNRVPCFAGTALTRPARRISATIWAYKCSRFFCHKTLLCCYWEM